MSPVDNNIIWGMSETTSGAYCQQCGATCICDAVFSFKNDPFQNIAFIINTIVIQVKYSL